ncbi:uncharacterized protein LOC132296351 [Cornus florida]|uniref:uncharacterized protein LOC132296351 n=1 Tax=Cornus florida TaxID=4283 RepID=UPI00289717DB|nr:uncharacterized protein LOC132296351 [Cornus florida]
MSILATFFTVILTLFIKTVNSFKSGWNFLFQQFNFRHKQWRNNGEDLNARRYEGKGFEGAVECAVCLCKIEEGDEIRELRCVHLFHRVCLDRWVGFGHMTCPLCRGSLRPRRSVVEVGEEVLLFKFCSSRSRDRDLWWLR